MGAEGYNFGNTVITGDVSFPGLGGDWQGQIYLIGDAWNLEMVPDGGRGDGAWPAVIPGGASGTITVRLHVTILACPNPTLLNGQAGTITKKWFAGKTETIPIRVHKRGTSFAKKDQDWWEIILTAQIIDQPSQTGWTPPTSDTETFDDKVLWSGMMKNLDAYDLKNNAQYKLRIYGMADNDAAEEAAIRSHFADTPGPFTDSKQHDIVLERAPNSPNLAYLVFHWGMNTTRDDVIYPGRFNAKDFNDTRLGDSALISEVGTDPGLPQDATLVPRFRRRERLTDGDDLYTIEYGRKTPKQDVTTEGTAVVQDFADSIIGSSAREQMIWDHADTEPTSTVPEILGIVEGMDMPAGLKVVRIVRQQHDSVHSRKLVEFDYRYEYEKLIAERTTADIDISAISSVQTTSVLYAIASPPSEPSTLSGYEQVSYHDENTNNPAYKLRVRHWALLTHAHQIEYNGTSAGGSLAAPPSTSVINVQTVISTVASTATVQALANTTWTTDVSPLTKLRDDKYLEGAFSIKKLSPTVAVTRVMRLNDDQMVIFGRGSVQRTSMMVDPTGAFVRVVEIVPLTGADATHVTTAKVRLGPYGFDVVSQYIILRQRFNGVTALTSIDQHALWGKSNTATFLGRVARSMVLMPPTVRFNNAAIGTAGTYILDFPFKYETYDGNPGHIVASGVPQGWLTTIKTTTPSPIYSYNNTIGSPIGTGSFSFAAVSAVLTSYAPTAGDFATAFGAATSW